MVRNRVVAWMLILLASLTIFPDKSTAAERKKPKWLASCPVVKDVAPESETPKTIFLRAPTGQVFKLLKNDSLDYVSEPQSIVGCYVNEELVVTAGASPKWQIGSLNRDSAGFYFINGDGITWRLKWNSESYTLETEPGSPNHKDGGGFRIDPSNETPKDCKVKEFYSRGLNLGFPRNNERVAQLGQSKNLIIVVDFPDSVLTEDLNNAVENILAPKIVRDFLIASSNEKFKPEFVNFPKVVRLKSSEKSFSPDANGGFFVNGQHQPTRLILEAIGVAKTLGDLGDYASLNILAPTALSLGYFGAAFPGTPIDINGKTHYNAALYGGGIGTINSLVPSWKVFAHEYGHLLGMYDYYLQGTSNSGKSPGPFDIMGGAGSANSFLGFQRWVQGWYEDSDVICDTQPDSSKIHTIFPVNSLTNQRLYVHPLNSGSAIVVELRTESKFDALSGNDGLLVYLIDMKVDSLGGSISIQHSEQDLSTNPSDDVARYKKAPLSTGQYVKVKDFVFLAENVNSEKGSFRVLTLKEFQDKLSTEKKLASSKTTITCVKGKLTKKVTAVKPVCPKGYKKK